jgi:hypothetical protein
VFSVSDNKTDTNDRLPLTTINRELGKKHRIVIRAESVKVSSKLLSGAPIIIDMAAKRTKANTINDENLMQSSNLFLILFAFFLDFFGKLSDVRPKYTLRIISLATSQKVMYSTIFEDQNFPRSEMFRNFMITTVTIKLETA